MVIDVPNHWIWHFLSFELLLVLVFMMMHGSATLQFHTIKAL
uniref:60S ribosomal protein L6-like n=1 Tax=Rhizophora mucronata TaxID=61149 RepID=A0A2P2LJC7_RHIMU